MFTWEALETWLKDTGGTALQFLIRVPVSYTHLDVYKRQGQRSPEARKAPECLLVQ